MMNKELALLDQIEEVRQKAADKPKDYPVDYTVRLISAIVAEYVGYGNRNDWTGELKKHPESKYTPPGYQKIDSIYKGGTRMINIDMWYGDGHKDADKIDISFYDLDCVYRGNIYKNGKIIGDYVCADSLELEKAFPQLTFNWD